MTIRALIVDDEQSNRENLKALLKKHCPEIEVIGEAAEIFSAQERIQSLLPDLIFLDVRMPGGDAFDLLAQLDKVDFEIIFITAYDQYAFQAFRFNAVDFLLKPIDISELRQAVEKVQMKINLAEENILLKNLVSNQQLTFAEKRLPLPTEDKVEFVPVKNIIHCQSDRSYTEFYLKGGKKLIICKTLKEYEKALTPMGFIRVHQSHLVNLSEVLAFVRRDGGYLQMSDNSMVPVSRSRKEEVQLRLMER
ncbi:MAG: response regulator transcription factor [Bacteroidetes bacterium]|jgi:two-component system, LytTR family, response regulator|nr:response regulator transcription factor [Bacteroidota bacterium]MBT4400484.1 response regulator transcription factor [Bacteroidota bacterium]MBT4410495.1 response regulator transcription factor [Bacteroidota bacterium]MBT5426196.1 response regulator transcription factor [Bacteroidota bacterium]MBT7095518.1 response regulator transcription factor [Bacteroidota bacterium]